MKQEHHPAAAAGSESRAVPARATARDGGRDDAIRRTAFLLYEARGRVPGHEMEDWLQAEMLVTLQEAADAAASAAKPAKVPRTAKAAKPAEAVEAAPKAEEADQAAKAAKAPKAEKADQAAKAAKAPKAAAKRAPARSRSQ